MPVSVAIVVADPPAALPGYTLCAFEVRAQPVASTEPAQRGRPLDQDAAFVTLPGSTDGYEDAVGRFVRARYAGVAVRLAAVAWWSESQLFECTDGRERLVSVFNPADGHWGEWIPEQLVGTRQNERIKRTSSFFDGFGARLTKTLRMTHDTEETDIEVDGDAEGDRVG